MPKISRARAKSSISAIDGGFSMFQPRRACASPASCPRNRGLSLLLRTLKISVSRSTVVYSKRR